MTFEEIEDDLAILESWEDRMAYIIDLGKALPPLTEADKLPEFKVEGCASNVWLVPSVTGDKVHFRGGSDALIVQGLIAVIIARLSGKNAKEILEIDARADFDKLNLAAYLSSQRSNGLRAMIERIRSVAQQIQ